MRKLKIKDVDNSSYKENDILSKIQQTVALIRIDMLMRKG